MRIVHMETEAKHALFEIFQLLLHNLKIKTSAVISMHTGAQFHVAWQGLSISIVALSVESV